MKVKIKTKEQLRELGYTPNDDPDDFYNLLADKVVTIEKVHSMQLYSSLEYPNHAIYPDYIDADKKDLEANILKD